MSTPMKTIETQIDIHSDVETVWSILTDFASYAAWNPFIRSVEGQATQGAKLRVRIVPPNGKAMNFRPRIVHVQGGRELRWVGRVLVPGVFDGYHSFRLAETGSGVRFYHCQRFTGLAAPFLSATEMDSIRQGFDAMNEALRLRAETALVDHIKVA